MSFVHEDSDFEGLLSIVADEARIARALVEKDYWVMHAMWALHQTGLEIWFKGGTSLSKGFRLIERFSEDLDLRIEPGAAASVPLVRSWTSTNKGPIAERRAFFESLAAAMRIPNAEVALDIASIDRAARAANYQVRYPGRFVADLGAAMRPFVQLEVGVARVTPFVARPIHSFVHDWLERAGQLSAYDDNLPRAVRCVHPMVTLIEKLDAIARRYPREPMEPAAFVRHYEDAAAIIAKIDELPPLEMDVGALIKEMIEERQIARHPIVEDPAFTLADESRRQALTEAHRAIGVMYWGARRSLDDACELIRSWLARNPA